jgi:hypothetical protein
MLREVAVADEAWSEGDSWVYGTWSQIRIGAAIAHAMAGEVDGAAGGVPPGHASDEGGLVSERSE